MKKIIFAWIIFQLLSIYAWSQELSFTVQPSQITVGIDDYFQISYNISNASDIKEFVPPNYGNFKLQGNPAQSSSNSINIINGKKTVNNTVTLTFTFKPNKIGNFQIGSASVVLDGKKFTTNPIAVQVVKESQVQQYDPWNSDPFEDFFRRRNVTKSRTPRKDSRFEPFTEKNLNKNVFIQLQVDKKAAFVGEQINVSYKLYTRLPMNMSLSKLPMLNGFWSQDLEAVQQQNLPKEELVNGVPFQVYTLKRSALFPQQTGSLVLDAAKAEGTVRVLALPTESIQESTDPFEAFFGPNPFGGDYGDYEFKDVRATISSPNVPIAVKPLPRIDSNVVFSGAVGKFKISSSISNSDITTDESIIYKINIEGTGNIKLIGRPQFAFNPAFNIVDGNEFDTIISRNPGIYGIKSFEFVINPDKVGNYTIPAYDYYYYDLESQSYKKISTSEHTFYVSKGTNSIQNENAPTTLNGLLDKPIKSSNNYLPFYFICIIFLGIINLLIYLFNKKSFGNKLKDYQEKQMISKTALKRLQSAKAAINETNSKFYEEISKAIWLYISDRLNIPISNLNKSTAFATLQQLHLSEATLDKYNTIIEQCEVALYAKDDNMNDRANILNAAGECITILEQTLKKSKIKINSIVIFLLFTIFSVGLTSKIAAQEQVKQEFDSLVKLSNNNPLSLYNFGVATIQEGGDKVVALALFEAALKNNQKFQEAKNNIIFLNDALNVPTITKIESNVWEIVINIFETNDWLIATIVVLVVITILHFLYFKKFKILFYKRIQFVLCLIFIILLIGGIAQYIHINNTQYGIIIDNITDIQSAENEPMIIRGEKVRILSKNNGQIQILNNKLQTFELQENQILIIE